MIRSFNLSSIPINYNFWVLSFFILYLASASSITENDGVVVLVFLTSLLLFVRRKRNYDKKVTFLLIFWLIINLLSSYINVRSSFKVDSFIGITIRFILPYLFVKIVGPSFFDRLIRYVYYLTLISFPIFLLQTINLGLFESVSDKLNFLTSTVHKEAGSWYIFTYMFAAWHPERNCGFMWEPGAFAGVLIFLISYKLLKNNFQIDKYIVVFFMGILSSFSTAGYLALSILIIAFLFKKGKKHLYLLLLIPLFIRFALVYYEENEFMSGKVEAYQERGTEVIQQTEDGRTRVSRFGIAIIAIEESIKWPFGYGIIESDYRLQKYGKITGPNSLASILIRWGWVGLIGYILFVYKFYNNGEVDKLSASLLTISFLIVLFSNPFVFKYLVYAVPFYVISFGSIKIKNSYENSSTSN